MRKQSLMLLVLASCSADYGTPADARRVDGAPPDATVDAPPVDAAQMVRVFGSVNYNGPVPEARVVTLGADAGAELKGRAAAALMVQAV